jgi:hypothetical protein
MDNKNRIPLNIWEAALIGLVIIEISEIVKRLIDKK